MNYKTTILLVALLLGLVGIVFFAQRKSESTVVTEVKKPPKDSPTSRELVENKPGDIVKITAKRRDQQEAWVFTKDAKPDAAGKPGWRMVSPAESAVAGYEIDRIATQLNRLEYDIRFKPGEPGVASAKEAGLDPAEIVVTLSDAAGVETTFEIGRPASDTETYVRLKGQDTIAIAKSNLKNLIKSKALEYRDLQLWTFAPEKAVKVEVIDRTDAKAPMTYRFGREGTKWVMEAPTAAKTTGKIDEMLRSMNRLRTAKWEDDRREKLAVYGLESAAYTVRVTTEEEVPAEKKEETSPVEGAVEAPKPEPNKKSTTYELHVSQQSPIGDDTKVYVRTADDALVGTVAKTVADKFKPVMSEWRDMHITTASVTEATRIEIKRPDEKTVLVKDLGRWKLEGQNDPAEDAAVTSLLKAIQDLTAVAFTEGETIDEAAMGLSTPQAEIRLTVPGVESAERLVIGGYTDAASKRLIYVRRNDSASAAKVKAPDVTALMQNPRTYRDRTVVAIPPGRFEMLTLTTPDVFATPPAPASTTLEKKDEKWTMTAPVAKPIRQDRVEKLVADLGALRADAIVADAGELSAYGLHEPAVKLQWTYKPPIEYRNPEAKANEPKTEPGSTSEPAKPVPVEFQPPSQKLELILAEHEGKHYAKRSDRPVIYSVPAEFYKQLLAELRTSEVLSFDETKVRRFTIRIGDQKHTFEKKDSRWAYGPEPDLPLDFNKIQNLLLQQKDLKTERYVRTGVTDLSPWGLAPPSREITIAQEDGTEQTLWISDRAPTSGSEKGNYAAVKGRGDVFLLGPDMVQRSQVNLPELEAKK